MIGISEGAHIKILEDIGRVLTKIDLTYRLQSGERYSSQDQEVQYILNAAAIAFILGHEIGHIKRGHMEKYLTYTGIAHEVGMNTSQIEESEADVFGVFSMLYMKRDLYRLGDLTDAMTATALMQVPIACVLLALSSRQFRVPNLHSHPHPVARLFASCSLAMDIASVFLTDGEGLTAEETKQTQLFMNKIIDVLRPEVHGIIREDQAYLSKLTSMMLEVSKPLLTNWLESSHQFGAFDERRNVR